MGKGPEAKLLGLPVDPATGEAAASLVALTDRTFGPAETKNPLRLLTFIQQDRKMIIYHGTSDPAIPAARSVQFYNDLAGLLHGRAPANVRLFLVPGMQHCSGGIGPDQFDTLSALEAWAERGQAPDAIPAATKPDAPEVHNLPLCPYPRQARYAGRGAVTDAANWACSNG
jgi:feruloyl esterase